jgi:prolyl-tRNA synthetase
MLYSKLFPKTLKQMPQGATLASHKLLYQAGYIRESTAGRYYLLPLAMRVFHKIQRIIKEEMDATGAQELITPVLHPKTLWEETNRTSSVGFELMSIKDRSEFEFVLGGTAEEMLVDLVRKFQVSYKDLPFNLYQFSTKFRDEMRARGGLLRVREFVMKDAYSFHATEEDFKKEYEKMWKTYSAIFERMGLKTVAVESDNGYIGGEYCHEFVVESEAGESRFLTDGQGYSAHEDVAKFTPPPVKKDPELKPMEDVEGIGIIGVEELAEFLKIPVETTTKTILFETEKGEVIAAAVRGGYEINEAKLKKVAGAYQLNLASPETVKKVTGAEVGYAGMLNLPPEVKKFFDITTANRTNFEMGANRTNYHTVNVNFGRDIPEPEEFYDFAIAREGDIGPNGCPLIAKKGIEVGNIFQLGLHYSSKMSGAHFIDEKGQAQPYYMGCYGIGLARTLATIAEVSNDEKGIIWPESVAPFKVHLIGLDLEDGSIKSKVEEIYKRLGAEGVEVLYDDRNARAGEKFADADLIGIPNRIVVSKKTGDKLEMKKRGSSETRFIGLEDLIKELGKD